jgi:SAM-dependent methyltransferase
MPTVSEHYEHVLADVYSWMLGGFDAAISRNAAFFERLGVSPIGSGRAVDLGAGCGFQAIPLARAGFSVTAIDLDGQLLDELRRNDATGNVRTVKGDMLRFTDHIDGQAELAVCMTDTLLHLESADQIRKLFTQLHQHIEPGGRFIATFRDLSSPLRDLDRFIPVRSDDSRILTCFLERADDRVRVHDLLWQRIDGNWHFSKSFYYKLSITPEQAGSSLLAAGFDDVRTTVENGLVTIVATN